MAHYDGDFELRIDKSSLSESERKEFELFLDIWRENHPLDCDWIEGFDPDDYSAIIYDMNTPETIEDLQLFLNESIKKFTNLSAKGDGRCSDVMTGEWQMDYRFEVQEGNLTWDERVECEAEDEDEEYDEEEYDSTEEAVNTELQTNNCKSLKDLLPNLNENAPSGLKIINGSIKKLDFSKHIAFAGEPRKFVLYCPPEVTVFDYFINFPDSDIDIFIITTAVKIIDPGEFAVYGIDHFYIIDEETKEVLFYSDKFSGSGLRLLHEKKTFINFADAYNENQNKAMHNKKYGIAY